MLLETFNVLVERWGGENKRVWCLKRGSRHCREKERERGDGRGCGNGADAHVKHGGEGGKGIWQRSPNLQTRSESHWRHVELSLSLILSLSPSHI